MSFLRWLLRYFGGSLKNVSFLRLRGAFIRRLPLALVGRRKRTGLNWFANYRANFYATFAGGVGSVVLLTSNGNVGGGRQG